MSEIMIKTLQPIRAAYFHAFSETPEDDAWKKAAAWAEPRGLLGKTPTRVFGRNNPPPSAGKKEYGYEFFVELEPGSEAEEVRIEELSGGPCAVLGCEGVEQLPDAWRRLYDWVTASGRKVADHGLEQCLNPGEADANKLKFDLWLPIEE